MTLEQRARSLAQYAASCCQWLHDGTPRHYTDRCEAKMLKALKVVERDALERAAQVIEQCNREGPYQAIGAVSRIRALSGELKS